MRYALLVCSAVLVFLISGSLLVSTAMATVTASPSAVNFGAVNVNSLSAPTAIVFTNTGTRAVFLQHVLSNLSQFTVTGPSLPAVLGIGQSMSFHVVFQPTAALAASASLTFTMVRSSEGTLVVPITGTGVQAELSVIPASISFGSVPVGVTNTQTVTLRNPGTANLVISQAAVSGSGLTLSGISLPITMTPGGSSSFTVAFDPHSSASITGALTLVSNTPNSPLLTALSGTGISQVRLLSSNSASLNFGSLAPHTSASQTVTLTNSGNTSLTVSQLNLSGAGFSDSGMSLPLTLAAGQSTSFNAVFDPATSGTLSGSATIVSNATNSPMTIALSGSGAAPVAHSVSLAWVASTSSVVGYNVYGSSQSGGPYTRVNSSPISSVTYTASNLVSGDSYFFVATAIDSAGLESTYSNQAEALIP